MALAVGLGLIVLIVLGRPPLRFGMTLASAGNKLRARPGFEMMNASDATWSAGES